MSCNFLLQEFWVFWIRYVIIVGSRIINRRFSRVQARHYADHVTNSKGSKFLQEKLQPMQLSEFDSIVQKVLPFSLESIRSYLQILLWGRSRGVWLNLHLKPSKHVPFRDHTDLNFQVVTLVIICDSEMTEKTIAHLPDCNLTEPRGFFAIASLSKLTLLPLRFFSSWSFLNIPSHISVSHESCDMSHVTWMRCNLNLFSKTGETRRKLWNLFFRLFCEFRNEFSTSFKVIRRLSQKSQFLIWYDFSLAWIRDLRTALQTF